MVKIEISGKSLILKTTEQLLEMIRNYFSVEKKRVDHNDPFAATRDYAITLGGSFHVGLLQEVKDFLIENSIPFTVSPDAEKRFSTPIMVDSIEPVNGIEYRDYQEETIKKMLSTGRGIAELPTSAGKTAVMAGFCKTYRKHRNGKILILVPNNLLLYQAKKDFEDFGVEGVSLFSGETKDDTDWSCPIIIASYMMITQKKKTKEPLVAKRPYKWLKKFKKFDVVIVDEVHQLSNKDNSILKFVANCETTNKFGMTGTVPDDLIPRWTVVGRVGPVIYKKSSAELREVGFITQVRIKIFEFPHQYVPMAVTKDDPPTKAYTDEKEYLMNNKKRNSYLVQICQKAQNNVLVIVDRIEHGEILESYLNKHCSDKIIYFAWGKTPSEEREEIKRMMENNDNIVCVAIAKLFSTGVSIKNLPWVILTGIGKSKIQLLQTIGRALRLHDNKKIATIFDMADDTHYSYTHLLQRIEYYEREKIDYTYKKI